MPPVPRTYRRVLQALVVCSLATTYVASGAMELPLVGLAPLRHEPVLVEATRMLTPIVVRPKFVFHDRGRFDRATPWEPIRISLTRYCLQGTTRRGRYVRQGIVAADPRVFPLARYVEVFLGKRYLGRFLVDDTGGGVNGPTLDIWTESCSEASRFGRQHGFAMLVPHGAP